MMQIRARIPFTYRAAAVGIDRPFILFELRLLDGDAPESRKQPSRPPVAGRHHTIEQIDPAGDPFDQILGKAHPHQIARLILGQSRKNGFKNAAAILFGFPYRKATDGIAIESNIEQAFERCDAKILINSALHDRKQRRGTVPVGRLAARSPAQR